MQPTKDGFHMSGTVSVQHLVCVVICDTELSWRDSDIFAVLLVRGVDVKVALAGASFVHKLKRPL